jgi:hypothetical protein
MNYTNTNKIDRRIHYIMMMDTETANTLMREDGSLDMTSVFVYDIGWQVTDKRGFLYEQKSYIVKEIFFDEAALMKSAYYASKIPQYLKDIAEGKRIVASYYDIRKDFIETMQRYETNTVCAHNARFDYNATNTTERWLTKSKYRFFLPYGTEVWDTLKMARDVVSHTPTYIKFCEENGFMTKHKTPRPRLTAEILYRYITGNLEFEESHTGLEDVDIERQILAYCFAKHKAMAKGAWEQSHYMEEIEVND